MKVTIAEMIDKLCIVNSKIFHLENLKRDTAASNEIIADATKQTNNLNVQRNTLIDEINLALNDIAMGERQQLFGSNKMYGK